MADLKSLSSRRTFLGAASAAAVMAAVRVEAQSANAASVPFVHLHADDLHEDVTTLNAAPGNKPLFGNPALPVSIVLTAEKTKAAKEFEYHEGRDHIFQILEGATTYELGGTPVTPRQTKPGEWLAPASDGAKSIDLKKGDLLVVPRGTPHRRKTKDSVTFYLISSEGAAK